MLWFAGNFEADSYKQLVDDMAVYFISYTSDPVWDIAGYRNDYGTEVYLTLDGECQLYTDIEREQEGLREGQKEENDYYNERMADADLYYSGRL